MLASDTLFSGRTGAMPYAIAGVGLSVGLLVPGAITSRCEAGLRRGTYKQCSGESTDLTYSSVVTDE